MAISVFNGLNHICYNTDIQYISVFAVFRAVSVLQNITLLFRIYLIINMLCCSIN